MSQRAVQENVAGRDVDNDSDEIMSEVESMPDAVSIHGDNSKHGGSSYSARQF